MLKKSSIIYSTLVRTSASPVAIRHARVRTRRYVRIASRHTPCEGPHFRLDGPQFLIASRHTPCEGPYVRIASRHTPCEGPQFRLEGPQFLIASRHTPCDGPYVRIASRHTGGLYNYYNSSSALPESFHRGITMFIITY